MREKQVLEEISKLKILNMVVVSEGLDLLSNIKAHGFFFISESLLDSFM